MITTDGLNSLWVSRLINEADARAQIDSQLMGLTVGGLSVLIGLFDIAKYLLPGIVRDSEGYEMLMGLAVIGTVALILSGNATGTPAGCSCLSQITILLPH